LRKYKPDYTPRSGFAWPIAETTTTQEKTGEANKKQTDDPSTAGTGTAASLPDADPELVKKLEKEKSLMHPKKQQNTMLLLNAMRTTAAHSFRTFHEREAAAAAATAAALSEGVAASEGQRSSATPVPAPLTSQSFGSQSSGPSASQDSAKGTLGTAKRKKKRMCVLNIATLSLNK
jgi:mediator of RNA polymerase II transcription subunit 6